MGAALLVVFGCLIAAGRMLKSRQRAAILATAALAAASVLGDLVYAAHSALEVLGITVRVALVFGAAAAGTGVLFVWIIRTKRKLGAANAVLNATGIILCLVPLVALGMSAYRVIEAKVWAAEYLRRFEAEDQESILAPTVSRPDVYYIILDGYANEKTLREGYGYDNSAFYAFLKEKQFMIASQSRSNYHDTTYSLASSLNMIYLDDVAERYGAATRNNAPLRALIMKNRVEKIFRRNGYALVNIGGADAPTVFGRNTDINKIIRPLRALPDYFALSLLYWNQLSRPVYERYGMTRITGQKVLREMKELEAVSGAKLDKPKFVFAHIDSPHPPHSLDEACQTKTVLGPAAAGYVAQLKCLNTLVEEAVAAILENSPTPPIIILQSDHGWQVSNEDMQGGIQSAADLDAGFLRERLRNFTAAYLPGAEKNTLPPDLTPVNLFRIIFNSRFGARYPFLSDKIFIAPNNDFRFLEVTGPVSF